MVTYYTTDSRADDTFLERYATTALVLLVTLGAGWTLVCYVAPLFAKLAVAL
jgi:hypothetical protein